MSQNDDAQKDRAQNDAIMRRTRRALLTMGASAIGAGALWTWIQRFAGRDLGAPGPLRGALEANGALWDRIANPEHISRVEAKAPPADGAPARVNGDLGLAGEQAEGWIDVDIQHDHDPEGGARPLLARALWSTLPRARESALFCCIEGWSEDMTYAGVRFAELMDRMGWGRKPDGSLYRYVGLATPDLQYYVSVDMASMRHAQTLLADELNGAPLTAEHGAPLRLMIPIKYGIKSLKRVGSIEFSDERPDDYWNQRGYDWYAGL